jgi:hypothetical protein
MSSIDYISDQGVIQCNKRIKGSNGIVAGPGQWITGECCGKVLHYTLDLPQPENRVVWEEPVVKLEESGVTGERGA